ncbi:MAG TPA: hypothetical protein P5205_12470 [Candidatus Paceibacterota bacterium]|nr:hypothetical protein [Verrucomicrobiota bacterium]HSA11175.1 hypothetical protein [Candidatus Paceibacterota bacterium]
MVEVKLDANRGNLVGATLRQRQSYLQHRKEFPPEGDLVVVKLRFLCN